MDLPERDEAWFEAVFRAEVNAVWAYAARRVPDPDDVVSEVFAAAWRHRDTLPDPARPWLLRAAHHHVQHVARSIARRGRLADRVGRPDHAGDHAQTVAEGIDASAVVTSALARLSTADRELLRLYAWDQLGVAEIAAVLGSSETATKVRLHRARKRLAALVGTRTRAADRGHDTIEVHP